MVGPSDPGVDLLSTEGTLARASEESFAITFLLGLDYAYPGFAQSSNSRGGGGLLGGRYQDDTGDGPFVGTVHGHIQQIIPIDGGFDVLSCVLAVGLDQQLDGKFVPSRLTGGEGAEQRARFTRTGDTTSIKVETPAPPSPDLLHWQAPSDDQFVGWQIEGFIDHDPATYLVVLTLVLFSAPVLAHMLLLLLRRDAASAFYDPLTGLLNRRGFDSVFAERVRGPGVVMIVDLDDFKGINDTYGHARGDMVLRDIASALHSQFAAPALSARIGGEEFLILDDADDAEAFARAERLLLQLHEGRAGSTTVSIGVARLPARASAGDLWRACGRADAAMYTAKQAGGNSIHIDDARPIDL